MSLDPATAEHQHGSGEAGTRSAAGAAPGTVERTESATRADSGAGGEDSRRGNRAWGRWWPNRCAVCRSDTRGLQGRICGECVTRFAPAEPRCRLCALPLASPTGVCGRCLREAPPWSRAIAACDYVYPWDGLITALKFGDAIDLAVPLADLLADAVPADPRAARAQGHAGGSGRIEALVPMPLSDARLKERGYNQAALLARRLGHRLGLPMEDGWLLRTTDRERQTALPREQRLSNLRGAFAVEPLALARLRGRRIALIDDVMTTGATLAEASRTLLSAGAVQVEVWVVGRTPG